MYVVFGALPGPWYLIVRDWYCPCSYCSLSCVLPGGDEYSHFLKLGGSRVRAEGSLFSPLAPPSISASLPSPTQVEHCWGLGGRGFLFLLGSSPDHYTNGSVLHQATPPTRSHRKD